MRLWTAPTSSKPRVSKIWRPLDPHNSGNSLSHRKEMGSERSCTGDKTAPRFCKPPIKIRRPVDAHSSSDHQSQGKDMGWGRSCTGDESNSSKVDRCAESRTTEGGVEREVGEILDPEEGETLDLEEGEIVDEPRTNTEEIGRGQKSCNEARVGMVLHRTGEKSKGSSCFGGSEQEAHHCNTAMDFEAAGNKAFEARRYPEAIEQYTSALENSESGHFSAKCFYSRAAAYQAQDQIIDAIQDCNFATSLNPGYLEALSRRSELYEIIRNFMEAANDLAKYISLLEKTQHAGSTNTRSDLKYARARLSKLEKEAWKETPLDMYMILGFERTSSSVDVKKSYRKAALRHHPDKVGYYLKRTDNVNDEAWREIVKEARSEADKLFKMIGEAYTIISDTNERLQYDAEEEMWFTSERNYNRPWGTRYTPEQNYYPAGKNGWANSQDYYNMASEFYNSAWRNGCENMFS